MSRLCFSFSVSSSTCSVRTNYSILLPWKLAWTAQNLLQCSRSTSTCTSGNDPACTENSSDSLFGISLKHWYICVFSWLQTLSLLQLILSTISCRSHSKSGNQLKLFQTSIHPTQFQASKASEVLIQLHALHKIDAQRQT